MNEQMCGDGVGISEMSMMEFAWVCVWSLCVGGTSRGGAMCDSGVLPAHVAPLLHVSL